MPPLNLFVVSPPTDHSRLFTVVTVTRWAIALFFLFLTYRNFAGDPKMVQDFESWGYPHWFRILTAFCQLGAASLLLFRPTAFLGASLIMAMMAVATYSHLRFNPPVTALSPLLFFCVGVFISYTLRPAILR